jgi:1,4-dihydroxy-2-naphthoyl-CoA hydrolase
MTSTPARSGMPGHFGIRVTDAAKDKLVGELDVDDRHLNNGGHVHGGALAAFADDLGGRLAGLNVPPGFRTTTIESKTNIFRACVPGRLTGVAVPVHVGRRMIVVQTSIYRPDGKLAAMMIQTQMVEAPARSSTWTKYSSSPIPQPHRRTLIHECPGLRACHVAGFDGIDLEFRAADQVIRLAIQMTAPTDPLPVRRQPTLPASSPDFR